jgi:purine-binding chemotaxis protein CheW
MQDQQFCTFYVDGLYFGIEVLKVQEVIRHQEMTRVPLASPVIKGLINLRGQIVTAIDLRHRLELPPLEEGKRPMNVVVRTSDGAVSLLADEIGDVVNVGDAALAPTPETLRGVARELIRSVYKLEGKLLLILKTDEAIELN